MELLFNSIESVYLFFRAIGMAVTARKHYQNDPPGYIPPPFSGVLKKTKFTIRKNTATHWIISCRYLDETRESHAFLQSPYDANKPTLIFHHGAGEIRYAFPFYFVFGRLFIRSFNVFLLKAQKHQTVTEYLTQAVDTFSHQQQTFVGSVLSVEAINQEHHNYSKQPIIVTGTSMGGIVTALHAFHFGTANHYFPLVAYPNVGEIFLGNAYKYGVSGWEQKRNNPAYLRSYTIHKQVPRSVAKNITPILGKYDRVVPYKEASTFWASQNIRFLTFPYGHLTPAIIRQEIRRLVLDTAS